MSLDIDAVRAQFPALGMIYRGKPAIFLDNPGGTQVAKSVIDAVSDYYRCRNANVQGGFETSRRTDAVIADAHQAVAEVLGCCPEEVIFGNNMTSLTFHLARSLKHEFDPEDEIVVTHLDHDANIAPWLRLAEDSGATVRWVEIHPEDCTLHMQDLQNKITSRTKLVAVGYASNATGTINDVKTIVGWAGEVGAYSFIDAVQYAPHGLIDVRDLGCDFLACSSYKFFGPHSGQLYGKREHLEHLRPYKVRPATEELPGRWETGTQNHEGMSGVTAAIDYIASLGVTYGGAVSNDNRRRQLEAAWDVIGAYENALTKHLIEGLRTIRGCRIFGVTDLSKPELRLGTISLRKQGRTPQEMAERLAAENIFCWAGNFYALAISQRLGVENRGGFLRIGLTHYNTLAEIDRCMEVLESA